MVLGKVSRCWPKLFGPVAACIPATAGVGVIAWEAEDAQAFPQALFGGFRSSSRKRD